MAKSGVFCSCGHDLLECELDAGECSRCKRSTGHLIDPVKEILKEQEAIEADRVVLRRKLDYEMFERDDSDGVSKSHMQEVKKIAEDARALYFRRKNFPNFVKKLFGIPIV